MVEPLPFKQVVVGSTPTRLIRQFPFWRAHLHLLQLHSILLWRAFLSPIHYRACAAANRLLAPKLIIKQAAAVTRSMGRIPQASASTPLMAGPANMPMA